MKLVRVPDSPPHPSGSPPRIDWLDQARGAIVLFLVVTMAASALTGGKRLRPILAPTFLTHGSQYANVEPRIITVVDHGAQMFLFLMGFTGWAAFTRRLQISSRKAWNYVIRRAAMLLALGIVLVAVREWRGVGPYNWQEALYEGTFGKLAIAAVVSSLVIRLAPMPQTRLMIAAGLMLVHMILWDQIELTVEIRDSWLGQSRLPWGAVNSIAIAIAATAFGQWVFQNTDSIDRTMRTRLFPALIWTFVAFYVTSWLQHAVSFELTTSHALGGICCSLTLLLVMYAFGQLGLRFPVLTSLGRNLFLLFLIGGVGTVLYAEWLVTLFERETLAAWPSLRLLLFGVVPYVITIGLGVFLDRKQIYVRI